MDNPISDNSQKTSVTYLYGGDFINLPILVNRVVNFEAVFMKIGMYANFWIYIFFIKKLGFLPYLANF